MAKAKGSRSQDAGPQPSAKRSKQTIRAVHHSSEGCSTEPRRELWNQYSAEDYIVQEGEFQTDVFCQM